MEDIKSLRIICQSSRRKVDGWYVRSIGRRFSIYITWLLLHIPISANGATLLSLIIGVIASSVFIVGTKQAFLIGSILLQFWYTMDVVDGEIARYKKQTSATGLFFDWMTHYILHPFIFLCIGIGLCNKYANFTFFAISIIAGYGICMITLTTDILSATLYVVAKSRRLSFCEAPKLLKENNQSMLKKIFSATHLLCTFPSIMNALLLFSVLNLFTRQDLIVFLAVFYAIFANLVWIARLYVFIKEKKVDKELMALSEKSH